MELIKDGTANDLQQHIDSAILKFTTNFADIPRVAEACRRAKWLANQPVEVIEIILEIIQNNC